MITDDTINDINKINSAMVPIPYVIEETMDKGMITIDIFSRLLRNRIIMIIGEINMWSATIIVSQIMYLSSISNREIYLYINSPGGLLNPCWSICDSIKVVRDRGIIVNTVCLGIAASCGALILSFGTKGHRYIMEHGYVLIHQPAAYGISGTVSDILIAADDMKRTREFCNIALAENCSQDIKKIEEDTNRDFILYAEEAIAYGIVDNYLK